MTIERPNSLDIIAIRNLMSDLASNGQDENYVSLYMLGDLVGLSDPKKWHLYEKSPLAKNSREISHSLYFLLLMILEYQDSHNGALPEFTNILGSYDE